MANIKHWLKKYVIPEKLLKSFRPLYHGIMALAGNFYFGRPSNKLIVIGVTGTNGKTTAVNLIGRIMEEAGLKAGIVSTAVLDFGQGAQLNRMKITTPSGWLLHKWLKTMFSSGCSCAVLEVSSEGLAQNRHLGINFDAAVFTNLTPEHLEAHGGFTNYQKAKARLFERISKSSIKKFPLSLNPSPWKGREGREGVQKTIIVNADDKYASYFASFPAQKHISYGVKNLSADVTASDIKYSPNGIKFSIFPPDFATTKSLRAGNFQFSIHLKGQFDVYNSLAAIAAAEALGISLDICRQALEKTEVVPGRMEIIQNNPFVALVDYAYEPEEMRQLYETIQRWPHQNIIQVMGPTGGGRDKARIKVLGEMAGRAASQIFITTDDPYDEDPALIGRQMLEGALAAGKIENQNVFLVLDRRAAINQAFKAAQAGDIVLITGKGADQKMALANEKYADWDDRKVAREELMELSKIK